ncbi:MAG TPA: 4Fe-4S binding protein [Dehalococcoidia bacterium]|nr:4Fe-4S binding protein [Dehalococcoidia bacterium]
MLGVLKGVATTLSTMLRKPVTRQYPEEHRPMAHRRRGFPVLLWDHEIDEPFCTGCQVCARYCPVECMTVEMKDNPRQAIGQSKRRKIVDRFYIDYARCMRCNICVEVCNFDAIAMNNTWEAEEMSSLNRRELTFDLDDLLSQSKQKRIIPFNATSDIAEQKAREALFGKQPEPEWPSGEEKPAAEAAEEVEEEPAATT